MASSTPISRSLPRRSARSRICVRGRSGLTSYVASARSCISTSTRVVGLDGKEYRTIVAEVFGDTSADVIFPFAGLSIGLLLQATTRAIQTGTPISQRESRPQPPAAVPRLVTNHERRPYILSYRQLGNLRSVFAHVEASLPDLRWLEAADVVTVIASRKEVLARNTREVSTALRGLTASRDLALKWRERVDFRIHGWDHSRDELFENPDVRDFVYKLDEVFPFWLFFLSKHSDSLKFVTLCFLPPYLKPDGRASEFPPRLNYLLMKRWFPAMNEICAWVGMSDTEIDVMTDRVVDYLRN
jgi:hypothetical protein